MVTIKDIEEKAGVSTTTVSNVIHGKTKKVSPANIEKIQNLIKEMGYVQKMGLRVLRHGNSRLIAVVINSHKKFDEAILADPFYGKILGFIEEKIRTLGYYMMFYSADNLDDIFRMVMAWDIDGVVTLSFTKRDCEKMYYMIEKPVVSIDAYGELEGNQIVPNIGLDDISGGYMMTQYLLNIGYDQIFVCASRDHGVDHMRWEGAQQALGHFRQREAKVYFMALGRSRSEREKHYAELVSQIPFAKKTAAFFLSDLFAIEAMSFLADRKIKVPEQIGIAGYDDINYARYTTPKLTTVHQNIKERAVKAVDTLISLIEQKEGEFPDLEMEFRFPVTLITRQSV